MTKCFFGEAEALFLIQPNVPINPTGDTSVQPFCAVHAVAITTVTAANRGYLSKEIGFLAGMTCLKKCPFPEKETGPKVDVPQGVAV